MPTASASPTRPPRMLTFRSGGWVIALAGLVAAATLAIQLPRIRSFEHRATGDGTDPASYGFDLSTCHVPRDLIVASGQSKDSWPAMTDPPVIRATELTPGAKLADVRKLHGPDRVIGVVRNGAARAYPLWVLAWHEVVNDTLGGEPILVTYNPLCDSSAVFDRRVGESEREFGVSGLLYNSNLLMYDRQPGGTGESLWSQLQFRAVTGPAALRGERLTVLHARVVPWSEWRAAHPDTSVLLPDPKRTRLYKRDAFLAYFGDERLHFPVRPMPPAGSPPLKSRMVAWQADGIWRRSRETEFSPADVADDAPIVHSFWFAWHAMHGGADE